MSRLVTNAIRSTAASSDAITIDSAGKPSFPNGGVGKILQVVQTEKTDTWSTTSDFVFSDVTGLAVTITPSSSSSKVLVLVDVVASGDYWATYIKLLRGSTEIGNGATGMQSNQACHFSSIVTDQSDTNANGFTHQHTRQILDTPNTTSATTYKIQSAARNGNNNAYINRAVPDRNVDGEYDNRFVSRITAMEVAA